MDSPGNCASENLGPISPIYSAPGKKVGRKQKRDVFFDILGLLVDYFDLQKFLVDENDMLV